MKKKILIMGLPGAGKTYLARRLVPYLKAFWLNAALIILFIWRVVPIERFQIFKNTTLHLICDKIFFFFYFLQQILNKIDNYIPGMFPYNDTENDWISRT